jgi:hypothetical protein
MSTLTDAMKRRTNRTKTENGTVANKTTGDNLLDFFSSGGALRDRSPDVIRRYFDKAFNEEPLLALRCAFYIRDVREGQGERDIFRTIVDHLAKVAPDAILENLEEIPFYGRWDDLYALFDTKLEKQTAQFMHDQIVRDLDADNPSLCAKWLKSENASSNETIRLAKKTRKHFGWTPKKYRKTLSKLREQIRVVERKMSANEWDNIDFETVPSRAGMIYRDAFKRHVPNKYEEYLESVSKGEANMNADTLYPYELVRLVLDNNAIYSRINSLSQNDIEYIENAWANLPNYIGDKAQNAMAIADVSGSMSMNSEGRPMDVAISLAIYLAERNNCEEFKNKFITFSESPQFVEVTGSTFVDKIRNIRNADWDNNTNIKAVFDLFFDIAVENDLDQSDLPDVLYIISDMEFDKATGGNRGDFGRANRKIKKTLFQKITNEYNEAGYEMPQLIFWNIDARNEQQPMSLDDRGFITVSGCSPSTFESTMKAEFVDAYEFMLQVIDDERYQRVTF